MGNMVSGHDLVRRITKKTVFGKIGRRTINAH